jgi:hypothetical protein
LDPHVVEQFFDACKEEFVRGNAEERARRDAEGFVFPESDLIHDGESLFRLGSIEEVVKERHTSTFSNRFNSHRFEFLVDTTDAPVLSNLALFGAAIPVAGDFISNPIAEHPRKLEKKLGNCYCKHAHKLWKSGGALVFSGTGYPRK